MSCCIVLRCAFVRMNSSSTRYMMRSTGCQVPLCTRCVLIFLLFLQVISLGPHFPPPHANYTRIADQNVASPTITQHSAQHRATRSAQATLDIFNSLLIVARNHGPLLPAPFTCFSYILLCASEAGGVSRPSPCYIAREQGWPLRPTGGGAIFGP